MNDQRVNPTVWRSPDVEPPTSTSTNRAVTTSLGTGSASNAGLGFAGRNLATNHPHIFYTVGAVEILACTAGGVALMFHSIAFGFFIIALGLAVGLFTAWPGYWSEKHPERAQSLATRRSEIGRERALKHPFYFLIVIPLIGATDAALRWHSAGSSHDAGHQGTLSWTIPAAAGLLLGLAVGGFLVVRARRAHRSPG